MSSVEVVCSYLLTWKKVSSSITLAGDNIFLSFWTNFRPRLSPLGLIFFFERESLGLRVTEEARMQEPVMECGISTGEPAKFDEE